MLRLVLWGIVSVFLLYMGQGPASGQAKGSPKMVLNEQLVDFKDVTEGKDISHSFQVFNEGDETLKIEQVKPDCSCSVVQFDRLIPPNKQGKIRVKVDTKGFEGRQRWGVKVHNDPKWKKAIWSQHQAHLILSRKAVQFTGRTTFRLKLKSALELTEL
jgi:hypothetical protein